jgi:hypothetical protein
MECFVDTGCVLQRSLAFKRRKLFWLLSVVLVAVTAFLTWHPLRAKMSADETAAFLAREYPHQVNWRCVKGDPRWDYECAPKSRFETHAFAVIVDGDRVTSRTAP